MIQFDSYKLSQYPIKHLVYEYLTQYLIHMQQIKRICQSTTSSRFASQCFLLFFSFPFLISSQIKSSDTVRNRFEQRQPAHLHFVYPAHTLQSIGNLVRCWTERVCPLGAGTFSRFTRACRRQKSCASCEKRERFSKSSRQPELSPSQAQQQQQQPHQH